MTKATKIFFWISALGFAVGAFVDFGPVTVNPMWTVALPVGAIFLGVALISLVMEREMAAFDEEQAARLAHARRYAVGPISKPEAA